MVACSVTWSGGPLVSMFPLVPYAINHDASTYDAAAYASTHTRNCTCDGHTTDVATQRNNETRADYTTTHCPTTATTHDFELCKGIHTNIYLSIYTYIYIYIYIKINTDNIGRLTTRDNMPANVV
jgi:hypothetical protein